MSNIIRIFAHVQRIPILLAIFTQLSMSARAQEQEVSKADTVVAKELDGVTITLRQSGTRRLSSALNGMLISRDELFKAACCNLGESFTTNPSVDVNYSDATTGAKQIKLLGLSGTYVQMLTENLPDFRGAAMAYALDYVPGAWMKSIQVSKGASSVRNGFESITGQIDLEYLKPDDDEGVSLNIYGNTMGRMEANADANVHLSKRLTTEILGHYQNDGGHHDQNDDGFQDLPRVRQWNFQNRWKGRTDRYIFHGGVSLLKEKRDGGQIAQHTSHSSHSSTLAAHPYTIDIETDRYAAYMKHAYIIDPYHNTNIALMGNVALHLMDARFGEKRYSVNGKNAYAQLLFETDITDMHNLSAGLSLSHDYLKEDLNTLASWNGAGKSETTPGAYVQYTYKQGSLVTAIAGLRIDHSNLYGTFVTPRFHVKYTPHEVVSFRLSLGKGYRSPHPLAENSHLLATGRTLIIDELRQEAAWNYGGSCAFYIPMFGKTLKLNAENYRTSFSRQMVMDYDSDPKLIRITNLDGSSYSNTLQVDATYPVVSGLELTAAWRLNDVRCTYGGQVMEKPLTNRYKGLLSASYKTPLGLWQFDATLQLNGGGRMPTPYSLPDGSLSWDRRFHAYEQLQAQVTRWFRHFSVYVGGENLTGFRQQRTIIGADDPWSDTFDTTMIWGPVQGAMFYAGVRLNFGKL